MPLLASLTLLAQQAPPPASVPPSSDNGFIAGRVIDGDTQEPIRGAGVTMTLSTDFNNRRVLTTDETGAFSYGEARPGTYIVFSSAQGYAPGAFGRMRPGGDGSDLGLAARERVTTMVIRMWRFGQVSGRITDAAGNPVGEVSALSLFVGRGTSGRTYAARAFARTDATGRYQISNIFPGPHIVCTPFTSTTIPESVAQAARGSRPESALEIEKRVTESLGPRPGPEGARIGDFRFSLTSRLGPAAMPAPITSSGGISSYLLTCHGQSSTLAGATVIDVAPGDRRIGVDTRLTSAPTVSVSGIVRGPSGSQGILGMRLLPVPGPGELMLNDHLPAATTISTAEGAFTFLGVPPGRYVLRAFTSRSDEGPSLVMTPSKVPRPAGVALWSDQTVTVTAGGLRDLAVTLRPTARVNGRIVFDGASARPSPGQFSLQLVARQRLDPPLPEPSRVNADGTFVLRGYAPGMYALVPTGAGSWAVASMAVDGTPSPNHTLTLGLDDLANVVVTMTDRFTDLTGRVNAPGLSPIATAVLIFPADYRRWIADGVPYPRMRTLRPTTAWTYRASWLPPGDYLAVAYPEVEGEELSPEFIARLASRAMPITLGPGERKALDLTLVSVR